MSEERNGLELSGEFRGRVLATIEYLEKENNELRQSLARVELKSDEEARKAESNSKRLEIKVAGWSSIIALIVSTVVYLVTSLLIGA